MTWFSPIVARQGYLPHVDGLRALAVIGVLLFHLDFSLLGGGFVGVDVFFVISGYLITLHITQGVARGNFSFKHFYARRVRRLLPALFVTLLGTLIAGYFILPASGFERLGQETLFAVFSIANFLYWSDAGYFDTASELKPLLHTWSLSVEEQFYLLWPLLLFFVRSRRSAFLVLISLALLSLAAAEYWLDKDPALVFYMMPFRVVEFSVGALVYLLADRYRGTRQLQEGLTLLGLLLIVSPMLLLDASSRFPGFMALPVCIGTGLVIHYGRDTLSGKLLSWPPVVYVGLISYSLYLVHWPLIVLYKQANIFTLLLVDKIILLAVSLLLAVFMYHLVETPCRSGRGRIYLPGKYFSGAILSLFVVIVVSAGHIWSSEGWQWRFENRQLSASAIEQGMSKRFDIIRKLCTQYGWDQCRKPSDDKAKNILVLGDSHSVDGFNILYQAYPDYYYVDSSLGGCPPIMPEDNGILASSWHDRDKCIAFNQERLSEEHINSYSVIVISVLFGGYGSEHLLNVYEHIRRFSDAPIVVFGGYITLARDMSELYNTGVDPRRSEEVVRNFALHESSLRELSVGRFSFISKQRLFCQDEAIESCRIFFDDVPFSYDEHHLSMEATRFAAQVLSRNYPDLPSLIENTGDIFDHL